MKRFLSLLFLVISFTAESQPLRKGSHVILIRNSSNSRLLRITETSNISILTKSGKTISGKIRSIKKDSIFLADTLIRLSDIDKLYLWKFAFSDNPQVDARIPDYEAQSRDKEFICPPDSVFRSDWKFNVYMHKLTRKVKNERLAPLNPLVYKNFLKWNIAKVFHLELGFSYERMISKKVSWETEISGMLGSPTTTYSMSPISYPYYNYDGISITTYPKYYFKPRSYLSIVAMYRYLTAKKMISGWPNAQNDGSLQDQFSNDFGLSLRIGFMRRSGRMVFDYFVGIGIKYILLHRLDYGSRPHDVGLIYWKHQDHSPDIYNDKLFWPVFNLGIKIGRAFGQ